MNRPIVNRLPDGAAVADAVALAVLEKLASVLQAQPLAHFVVTGGTVGIASLASLARLDDGSVDWSRVHVWWGDERFVTQESGDRNAVQARNAWLNHCAVPSENIHEFPASDQGLDIQAASQLYCGIVDEVEKIDYQIFTKRAKTSNWRRTKVALPAYLRAVLSR